MAPGAAPPRPRSQPPLVLAAGPEPDGHALPTSSPDVGSGRSSRASVGIAWGLCDAWLGLFPRSPHPLSPGSCGNVCFLGFLKVNTKVICSLFLVPAAARPSPSAPCLVLKGSGPSSPKAHAGRRPPAASSLAPSCPPAWLRPSGGSSAPLLARSAHPVQGAV